MIIKAGTYRFNEILTVPDDDYTIVFPYTCNIDDSLSCYCNQIYLILFPEGEVRVNFASSGILFGIYDQGVWTKSFKSITIETDQTVDDIFGTWFTENTQMLIKAGAYRWNDTLTPINIDRAPINFFIKGVITEEYTIDFTQNQVCDYFSITNDDDIGVTMIYVYDYIDDLNFGFVLAYSSEFGWNTMYEFGLEIGTDSPVLKGYGQIITITSDQYVPTAFGLWANENWKEHSEEAPKRKFTRLYIGNTVASVGGKCFKRLTTQEPSAEITDLTGTTWYVPSGWSATAGYGVYKVNFLIPEKNADTIWDELSLGYASRTYGKTTEANSICCIIGNSDRATVTSSSSFTITIYGGTDATNPDLIAWLYKNGELQ